MSEPTPNAIAQWVVFEIKNRMKKNDIQVRDARLDWGKFYKGSKDHEISPADVDKIVIAPGSMESVSSCGREDSPSGTNGDFNLYDGSTKICNVYWDCPWGKKDNDCRIRSYDPETSPYSVIMGDWNHTGGAIGTVSITVSLQG